ncbi:hypothetical protein L6R50_03970 [Myxococcota bacterium]|nr:hypothetical protein [Myxococcota bacterium]
MSAAHRSMAWGGVRAGRRALPVLGAAALAGCSDYNLRPNEWTDTFQQELRTTVDILLVIDNSCSMIEEQQKLGENFEAFIASFAGAEDVSYQIGVVSTDTDSTGAGILQGPVITPDTADASAVFADVVNLGTTGSGYERGLEAAMLALSPDLQSGANAGFLRADASLSVVFLSDEEDSSPEPVDIYLDYLYAVKSPNGYEAYRDPRRMNVSAVVGPVPDGCELTGEDVFPAQPGERYIDLVTRTGGIFSSICDEDFSGLVQDLGLNISGLQREFYLTRWPDPATLAVSVDGERDAKPWTYVAEQNSILFYDEEALPPSQSVVTVTYTVVARSTGEGE